MLVFHPISVADPYHLVANPDAGPDSTYHLHADPDQDPSFKKRLKPFEKVLKIGSYSIHFGLTSANVEVSLSSIFNRF